MKSSKLKHKENAQWCFIILTVVCIVIFVPFFSGKIAMACLVNWDFAKEVPNFALWFFGLPFDLFAILLGYFLIQIAIYLFETFFDLLKKN